MIIRRRPTKWGSGRASDPGRCAPPSRSSSWSCSAGAVRRCPPGSRQPGQPAPTTLRKAADLTPSPGRWPRRRRPAASPAPTRACSRAPTARPSRSSSSSTTNRSPSTAARCPACPRPARRTPVANSPAPPTSRSTKTTSSPARPRSWPPSRRSVPAAKVGQRLRTVYGGVTFTAPANRLRDLASIPGASPCSPTRCANRSPTPARSSSAPTPCSRTGGAGARRCRGARRRPRQRRVAGAPVVRRDARQPGPAAEGRRHAAHLRLRRRTRVTPASEVVPLQPQADRRRAVPVAYLADAKRAADEKYRTARDSNGHGTHTASTAAGNVLAQRRSSASSADRSAAWPRARGSSVYKVCGAEGCMSSDSAAAVAQAIQRRRRCHQLLGLRRDRPVQTDPVELAFLDAYAAGVFVAASAGNTGPGAGTVNHLVAVGHHGRRVDAAPRVRLDADADGPATRRGDVRGRVDHRRGRTGTGRAGRERHRRTGAVRHQGRPPARSPARSSSASAAAIARVDKGTTSRRRRVGMILYNPTLQDVETDNHWLPTVHLADDAAVLDVPGRRTRSVTAIVQRRRQGAPAGAT